MSDKAYNIQRYFMDRGFGLISGVPQGSVLGIFTIFDLYK